MIVIDAGVLISSLCDDGSNGELARWRIQDEILLAPELIELEALSVIRKLRSRDRLTERRAEQAVIDLENCPVNRVSHRPILWRCWELRHNLTPYDASYVALAETLTAKLVTTDKRLAGAPGIRCEIEVLPGG